MKCQQTECWVQQLQDGCILDGYECLDFIPESDPPATAPVESQAPCSLCRFEEEIDSICAHNCGPPAWEGFQSKVDGMVSLKTLGD